MSVRGVYDALTVEQAERRRRACRRCGARYTSPVHAACKITRARERELVEAAIWATATRPKSPATVRRAKRKDRAWS